MRIIEKFLFQGLIRSVCIRTNELPKNILPNSIMLRKTFFVKTKKTRINILL